METSEGETEMRTGGIGIIGIIIIVLVVLFVLGKL
jgi:flagellar basal body-associated protein FliL